MNAAIDVRLLAKDLRLKASMLDDLARELEEELEETPDPGPEAAADPPEPSCRTAGDRERIRFETIVKTRKAVSLSRKKSRVVRIPFLPGDVERRLSSGLDAEEISALARKYRALAAALVNAEQLVLGVYPDGLVAQGLRQLRRAIDAVADVLVPLRIVDPDLADCRHLLALWSGWRPRLGVPWRSAEDERCR